MPCNAVVFAWATVEEKSLLKLLDPIFVADTIKKIMEKNEQYGEPVMVTLLGKTYRIAWKNLEVSFDQESGLITVSGGLGMEARALAAEIKSVLKGAASRKLVAKVAGVIRERGGTVYDISPMKEGWLLKVEGGL